jgi:hypothetical protein
LLRFAKLSLAGLGAEGEVLEDEKPQSSSPSRYRKLRSAGEAFIRVVDLLNMYRLATMST